MADDDVQVTFGAKIDDLVSGVKQVNDQLGSIKDKAGEVGEHASGMFSQIHSALAGIASPIRGIKDSLGELAEGFVAAFAVEKIAEYVEKFAQLGTETERTAAMFGLTTEQVGQMNAVAIMTGTSTEALSGAYRRLATNLQTAQSGTGPAAAAFRALGLNAKELASIPLPDAIGKIADKVSTWENGLNKTAIVQAALGRGASELIPTLNLGADGIKKMGDEANKTGTALGTPMTAALHSIHTASSEVSLSFQGLGATLVSAFAPAINGILGALSDLVNWFRRAVSEGGTFKGLLDLLADAAKVLAGALLTIVLAVEAVVQTVDLGFRLLREVVTGQLSGVKQDFKDFTNSIEQSGREWLARMRTLIGQGTSSTEGTGGTPAPNLNTGQGDAAALKAMDGQIKILQAGLATKKALYAIDGATYAMTEDQKIAATRAATDQENAAEIAAMQKTLATANLNAEQRKTIDDKISVLKQKHITEDLQFDLQAIQAATARYQEFFNALSSSFNGQLRGLLAGTTSWSAAFKSIMGDMVIFFIEAVEKMVIKWIIGKLAMTAADKSTQAAAVAAAAASSAASEVTALSLIQQKVGEVYAGAAAFFAPLLGPGAPAAAAGVAAEVDTAATALTVAGSAEQGAYEVQAGLWQLHDNETVLPAPAAQAFRDMAEGNGSFGGGALHLHGTLIDGPSIARFFKQNAGLQAKYLSAKASISPG